ncbi:unnamed protein product [Arctia plantaginis]|uniref:Centrosome-associated protein 350 n=1 Tax=Arctia plantaginis TaxID=874455 RepID=A0A8S0YZH2_ARCPL|nr:unnamed protein product [Arctia plantaginis]
MDASESLKPDADIKNVFSFILNIDGKNYTTPIHQKSSTVIKYTKLPDFEFGPRLWPTSQNCTGKNRTRRTVTIDNEVPKINRTVRSNYSLSPKIMATNYTKRKMITISEHEEHDLHPKFTRAKRSSPIQMLHKSLGTTEYELVKQSPNRNTSRLTNSPKHSKETKSSVKTNSAYNKKGSNGNLPNHRSKYTSNVSSESSKLKYLNEKDLLRITTSSPNKSIISKKLITPSESEKFTTVKNITYDNIKNNKNKEKPNQNRPPSSQNKNKLHINKMFEHNKTLMIRVPIDEKYEEPRVTEIKSAGLITPSHLKTISTCNRANMTDTTIQLRDVNVGTNAPKLVDQVTEMGDIEINTFCKCENSVQTDSIKEIFDSLEIPNVTLTKEKYEPKEETVSIHRELFPNLTVPTLKITPQKDVTSNDLTYCQSASYVFSRATVTYTTRQKINFHVVSNDGEVTPHIQPQPAPAKYPLNVVSVFRNTSNNQNKQKNISSEETKKKKHARDECENCLNELNSFNCSYVFNKLMKPSDIISTIRVNDDLLQNDYICEQFQRELNFIDSFFESLQYLESCSLSDKTFSESKVEDLVNNSVLFDSTFDIKNSEYDNFLSKLENGANIDDTETIASKSLFLLNLLIRDEQRRAKNLLFVLKMREDALKDFTKSQILWLEKKKKHDNTDISTLKKKQRGALLKLQHECGEMQRMRKALLTLSEKRKVSLMKTKKNIELKLKNNVDVGQIILGKKKLKRSLSGDRNNSPLKCFDLSSSGCEDSTTSKLNSDTTSLTTNHPVASITSAEKCVQAGDALWSEHQQQVPDIAAENFVGVDGGYLNILFHDLTLPQIFNSGKTYEVNEEMLKNIVNSTNKYNNNLTGSEVVEKLMEHIKNREFDNSSPSTARSLVEEFDQYYRGLAEEDKSVSTSSDREQECCTSTTLDIQTDNKYESSEEQLHESISSISAKEELVLSDKTPTVSSKFCVCESVPSVISESSISKDSEMCTSQVQTGPLPVPVGAPAVVENSPAVLPAWILQKSSESSSSGTDSLGSPALNSSLDTLPPPDQSEAEELRRQQLAIEREIKALEQQQSRLLVVREIPDKPPPPYTPPTESKPKPPRMFILDEPTEIKIRKSLSDSVIVATPHEENNAFDFFLEDYCHEALERHKQEQSDKPWDACNLLPQKPSVDTDKLVQNTIAEVKEVLTSVGPTVVSGVSSRRSDHIDDILFTEWKRCEPEWTNLHTDEAIVKNQIFETIFQKILTETVDEYKKTVTNLVTD